MRRTPTIIKRSAGLLGACALLACSDLPEITYETEHLRIGTDFDEPLCRGDLDQLEGLITALEIQLDTTVDEPIEVYIWGQADPERPDWCEEGAQGCYRSSQGTIYTGERAIAHELVHAVVDTIADPATFWSEGAADSLATSRTVFSMSPPSANLVTDSPNYLTAGHFSRWVLNTYGLDSYRALLRHPGSAREAFETTYGLSVEEAEAIYFEEVPASYGAMISCGYPELPSNGELSWSEELDIDCNLPHVYGGSLSMLAKRELEITERGHYAISTTAAAGLIVRCQDEDYDEPPSSEQPELYGDVPAYTLSVIRGYPVLLSGEEEPTVLDLTPGRYELMVGYSSHEPRSARVDVVAVTAPSP